MIAIRPTAWACETTRASNALSSRLVGEGERFKTTDALRRDLAELKNQAETLVYTTEQALEGYGDLLEPALLDEVKNDAVALKRLLEAGADLETLRAAYSRLEGGAFRIAESMYGDTATDTGSQS